MDPIDSGQGQEKPSEDSLSPSSRGRQRKKNSRYTEYETDYACEGEDSQQGKPIKSPRRGGETPLKRTSARGRKAKTVTQQNEDEEEAATDQTPQESGDKRSEETPKKTARAKKTPLKKTATKRTPTPAKVVDLGTVQQENGTPKPKRKYVKRQHVQNATPDTEPSCGKDQGEPPIEETEPGGRRRRGAARAALKYLHILAKEMLNHNSEESGSQPGDNSKDVDTVAERKTHKGSKVPKGRKRKREYDSDAAEDEDFVPDDKEEEEVEELESEESADYSDSDLSTAGRSPGVFHMERNNTRTHTKYTNGFPMTYMKTIWGSTNTTKKFREEHFSSWVFPEWVPSTSFWHLVSQSDLDKYLPEELQSAAVKVCREGVTKEEMPLQRLGRFEAVSAHPDRWDMLLFAGGPVWAMEWCPTPDGAPARQYVALACHRGMDDHHYVNKSYPGTGLVQLWDVGTLEYNKRPDSQPSLVYGLAQDKGFIWHLKWCPAGGWEPPTCGRKVPFLPRLGLLAVATSTSVVTIYSLPHPDALHSDKTFSKSGNTSQQPPIYKARGVLTLKLGAFRAPRHEKSGQVLCMDWLPEKPHNIIAIGFYDGTVGLWDLTSKSSLLRVREPSESLILLPYRCLLAHDHSVRALAFCPASRYLLVTAGGDRHVKVWDLRRLYSPITVQKRYLTNEIHWPLNAPGFLIGQESAYTPKGLHGVHYIDHYMRTLLLVPRMSTVWSISYTDWMNCMVTADSYGEVILSVLPRVETMYQYTKKTLDRRFPVYFTSLVPYETTEGDNEETRGAEMEKDAAGEQGGESEEPGARCDGGNENNIKNGREGGSDGKDESPTLPFETYKEAVKKYYLKHTDYNMCTFKESEKRAVWKRLKNTEVKAKLNLDDMTLGALHKVRFNPNMNCHTWLVSGGQTGLVRLNCLRGLFSSHVQQMISDSQAQFDALYSQNQKSAGQTVMR